jgi:hypothetical protein
LVKDWLDLSNNSARADVARHFAAIANYGGGFIVFGFTDAMQASGADPFSTKYDRDHTIGSATSHVLTGRGLATCQTPPTMSPVTSPGLLSFAKV